MSERPILFSGEMVRAILDGRKTMTRRVIKPQPRQLDVGFWYWQPTAAMRVWVDDYKSPWWRHALDAGDGPYHVGMHLWVRETWGFSAKLPASTKDEMSWLAYPELRAYRADNPEGNWCWRPSMYMPRWASRLTLEITSVRVERVQEISHEDALAEGIEVELRDMSIETRDYSRKDEWFQGWGNDTSLGYTNYVPTDELARTSFRTLWDSINVQRGYPWDSNPWVWAIAFKVVHP